MSQTIHAGILPPPTQVTEVPRSPGPGSPRRSGVPQGPGSLGPGVPQGPVGPWVPGPWASWGPRSPYTMRLEKARRLLYELPHRAKQANRKVLNRLTAKY